MTFITHITLYAYWAVNTNQSLSSDTNAYYLIAITDSQFQPGGVVKSGKDIGGCNYYQVYSYSSTFTPLESNGKDDQLTGIDNIDDIVSPTSGSDGDIDTEIDMDDFLLVQELDGDAPTSASFSPTYSCPLDKATVENYTIEAGEELDPTDHPYRQGVTYETPDDLIECSWWQDCFDVPDEHYDQSQFVSVENITGWVYDGSLVSDGKLETAIEVKYFWRVKQNPDYVNGICDSSNMPALVDYDDYPMTYITPVFDLVEMTKLKSSPPSSL